jgi:hypothetical protein
LWLALAAVLVLVIGGGGWLAVEKLWVGKKRANERVAQGASGGIGAAGAVDDGGRATAAGVQEMPLLATPGIAAGETDRRFAEAVDSATAAEPSSLPGKSFPTPIGQTVAQRPPQPPPAAAGPAVRREEPVRTAPTAADAGRAAVPTPPVVPPPDRAAADAASRSVEPASREGAGAAGAVADDAVPAVDRQIQSGLFLTFRVSPPDAHVLLGRTVIGRAADYSGLKGKPAYQLPGPGEHLIRLRKAGMRELRIGVLASEAGTTTPVVASLQPIPTEQVATEDLEVYRVQKAIALRVEPPGAMVSVDGQEMGRAARFAGGMGRPDAWLVLAPGRHRVTLSAPGFRRRDIAVEVSGGAERERQRIEVRLAPGGSDEG